MLSAKKSWSLGLDTLCLLNLGQPCCQSIEHSTLNAQKCKNAMAKMANLEKKRQRVGENLNKFKRGSLYKVKNLRQIRYRRQNHHFLKAPFCHLL